MKKYFLISTLLLISACFKSAELVNSNNNNNNNLSADEIINSRDANNNNLLQLNIENHQTLKNLIKTVGDEKALELALEGDIDYTTGKISDKKSALRMSIENDDEQALAILLNIAGIENKLDKKINIGAQAPVTLLDIAISNNKVNAFKALINKKSDMLYQQDTTSKTPLDKIIDAKNINMIKSLTFKDINHLDQGQALIHKFALEPDKLALLANNENLDANILNKDNKTAFALAFNFDENLTVNNAIDEVKKLEQNATIRNQSIDILLNIKNISDKTINDTAIIALKSADNINFKKLLATKKVILNKDLVDNCLHAARLDLQEITKLNPNNIHDANGGIWDADAYYKTKITQHIIDNLQALKDAGLAKENFAGFNLGTDWPEINTKINQLLP